MTWNEIIDAILTLEDGVVLNVNLNNNTECVSFEECDFDNWMSV